MRERRRAGRRWLGGVGTMILTLASGAPAAAERLGAYDYPFVDPVLATVVGTPPANRAAGLPNFAVDGRLERRHVRPFPERTIPDVFWYDGQGVEYGLARQPDAAPLIIIVSGTGASARATTSVNLAEALYLGGFHVVTLPSPTSLNFIINGSASMVPGRQREDAADLYRVIGLVLQDLEGEISWDAVHLTGYSLGGMNTAYLAELDARERKIGFARVLVLNPPVSLWNSTSILDGYFEAAFRNEPAALRLYLDQLITRFADFYAEAPGAGNLSGDFIYDVYRVVEPTTEDLGAIVGATFRLSAAGIALTSDVMTRSGYVVPRDARLSSTDPLGDYATVAMGLSFEDYIRGLYLPHFDSAEPGYVLERAIADETLGPIADFLRTAPHVALFDNEDDIILGPGEIEWLEAVFGSRATIFPTGGHCGNFTQREVVQRMHAWFRS